MRLIDADILLEQFRALRDNWDTKNATHRAIRGAFVDCILKTRDAPTVDAEPVEHGHLNRKKVSDLIVEHKSEESRAHELAMHIIQRNGVFTTDGNINLYINAYTKALRAIRDIDTEYENKISLEKDGESNG